MAKIVEPALKNYFFGKSYADVGAVIKASWRNQHETAMNFKDHMEEASMRGVIARYAIRIFSVGTMLAVYIFGGLFTVLLSLFHILILLAVTSVLYFTLAVLWSIEQIYFAINKIFIPCTECKNTSRIPVYLCPKCGAKHRNLAPGRYGILSRICDGTIGGASCGEKLPSTIFNGRNKLAAQCPHCDKPIFAGETIPICIPVVGGRSVGKTAFITAFSHDFIEEVVPDQGWIYDAYSSEKEKIYSEIKSDYATGETRMTARALDIAQTSSVSFSFFLKFPAEKIKRAIHIYDIAGEVFTDNTENEIQRQYEYCHGIAMIIDPFSIPEVRLRYEQTMSPVDLSAIGSADTDDITNVFLNKLRQVTGLSEKEMHGVPLAIILSKTDTAELFVEVGKGAVTALMQSEPETFLNEPDTQDFLVRQFLREYGMSSLVNSIDYGFKKTRFFSSSAIGHTRGQEEYSPQGVMEPMQWLLSNADSAFKRNWKGIIDFANTPGTRT